MATIHAPVANFTGKVAGVSFADGKGETSDTRALAYFRRHGYGIGTPADAETAEPPDPRHVGFLGSGVTPQGTRLRDAAIDPEAKDFLAPTNAGEANPHGPDVVSPGLHGVEGVRPVRPGDVAVDAPAVQDVAETAHGAAATDVEVKRPAGNASRVTWAAYAESLGIAVGDMSRDDIKAAVDAASQG